MPNNYNVGDLVQLKPGDGPVMVVNAAEGSNGYFCVWFAGKKREQGYFQGATLMPAPDPDQDKK